MKLDPFFFRLYSRQEGKEPSFAGSGFPVTPDGGFLTCRHVADVAPAELLVHDNIGNKLCPVTHVIFPGNKDIDLAFFRASIPSTNRSFLPLFTPSDLRVGEEVYSYGFFAVGGKHLEIEQGYFAGRIVNFTRTSSEPPTWSLTLPFPILEGMSGSPVITYNNGPKVVGLGYGNRSTRILASEVVEFEHATVRTRETINRIIEFGLAYHVTELRSFIAEASVDGFIVSSDRISIDGLE